MLTSKTTNTLKRWYMYVLEIKMVWKCAEKGEGIYQWKDAEIGTGRQAEGEVQMK